MHNQSKEVVDKTVPLQQNKNGLFVPAIPIPFYFAIRKGCHCGEKFWTDEGYKGHYAIKHILSI